MKLNRSDVKVQSTRSFFTMPEKMVRVNFTPHLRRFIDLPASCEVTGSTVRELIDKLEVKFPGVSDYLLHENGRIRQHVNLFLDQQLIEDRESLGDSVAEVKELHIMQALSGG